MNNINTTSQMDAAKPRAQRDQEAQLGLGRRSNIRVNKNQSFMTDALVGEFKLDEALYAVEWRQSLMLSFDEQSSQGFALFVDAVTRSSVTVTVYSFETHFANEQSISVTHVGYSHVFNKTNKDKTLDAIKFEVDLGLVALFGTSVRDNLAITDDVLSNLGDTMLTVISASSMFEV